MKRLLLSGGWQVLYVNMVTAVTMGMMLAMEPAEMDIMDRPPRKVFHIPLSVRISWLTA